VDSLEGYDACVLIKKPGLQLGLDSDLIESFPEFIQDSRPDPHQKLSKVSLEF